MMITVQDGRNMPTKSSVKLACKQIFAGIFPSDEYPMLLDRKTGQEDAPSKPLSMISSDRKGDKQMKKKYILWGIAAAIVVLAAIVYLPQLQVIFSPGTVGSVAIIGGADGPTSIFVAGKVNTSSIIHDSLVALAVGAVLLIGVIIWGKRN